MGGRSFTVLFNFFSFVVVNLFLAVLSFCGCTRAFSSCRERGLLSICSVQASYVVASLAVEHGLWGLRPSIVSAHKL